MSEGMIAALDGWRDLRDRSLEQIFLAIYSSPMLQAMVGLRAADEAPRHRPGVEPERLAFIEQRIGELKARLAEGGVREAAIRSLVYIGLAGPGIDERAFNVLREIRSKEEALTLDEFKQVLREQFFSLLLDQDAALAAIPRMLPADTSGSGAGADGAPAGRLGSWRGQRRTGGAPGADRSTVRRRRDGCRSGLS